MARRMQRPDRGTLASLIRETGGNMTRLAALLNCSKPTVYKWVYQLGLDGLAGVGASDPYGVSAATERAEQGGEDPSARKKGVNPAVAGIRRLTLVSSMASELVDPTINTSVRIRQSVWRRMRKAAIDSGKPVAALLEVAIEGFLNAEDSGKVKGKVKQ